MICVRDDMLKAMWAYRVAGALSGSVRRGVIRHRGQKVRQCWLVLVEEDDASCVVSELNGSGNFGG